MYHTCFILLSVFFIFSFETPFTETAARGDYARLREMAGDPAVDINQVDSFGNTALNFVAFNWHLYTVKLLVELKYDFNK